MNVDWVDHMAVVEVLEKSSLPELRSAHWPFQGGLRLTDRIEIANQARKHPKQLWQITIVQELIDRTDSRTEGVPTSEERDTAIASYKNLLQEYIQSIEPLVALREKVDGNKQNLHLSDFRRSRNGN